MQWALLRYGLPALLGAAALVLLMSQVMRWLDAPSHAPSGPPSAAPPVHAPAPPAPTEPATAATIANVSPPVTGAADADAQPALRLETRLGLPALRATLDAPVPSDPADPHFRLQPDDYLHSKEP